MASKKEVIANEVKVISLDALEAELTDFQRVALDQIWLHLLKTGKPLPIRGLQRSLGKASPLDVLRGISGSLLFETGQNGKQCLQITLLGAQLTGSGEFIFETLVKLLEIIIQRYEAEDDNHDVQSGAIYKELRLEDANQQRMLFEAVNCGLLGPWPIRLSAVHTDGTDWTMQITDSVVDLYRANSIPEYLEGLLLHGYNKDQPWSEKERLQQFQWQSTSSLLHSLSSQETSHTRTAASEFVYRQLIESSRIAELRALSHPSFDCSRLISLCSELCECSARGNVHASIMLTRAILDHVPPIFGCKNFTEVANNYRGESSFKKAMCHLEAFCRNIADLHLHTQIKSRHALPTMTQVDFAAPLDLLLGEIISILSRHH